LLAPQFQGSVLVVYSKNNLIHTPTSLERGKQSTKPTHTVLRGDRELMRPRMKQVFNNHRGS